MKDDVCTFCDGEKVVRIYHGLEHIEERKCPVCNEPDSELPEVDRVEGD